MNTAYVAGEIVLLDAERIRQIDEFGIFIVDVDDSDVEASNGRQPGWIFRFDRQRVATQFFAIDQPIDEQSPVGFQYLEMVECIAGHDRVRYLFVFRIFGL